MSDGKPACPECGETDLKLVRTVCKRCYLRRWRAGTHNDLPVPPDRPRGPGSIVRTEKFCAGCSTTKPIDAFNVARDRADLRQGYCRDCYSARWRARAPHYRDYELRRRYGITALEFELLLATQAGGCAICETTVNPDTKSLAVDHCHKTGKVRGILCGPCNKAIGLLRDDPSLLERAVTYLRE